MTDVVLESFTIIKLFHLHSNFVVDTIIIPVLHMTEIEAWRKRIEFLTQSSYS